MSYKSGIKLINVIVAVAMLFVYVIYASGSGAPDQNDLREWALTVLKFIAAAVVATIVMQILYHIVLSAKLAVKEGKDDNGIEREIASLAKEDEMDKQIGMRSERAGYICVGIGFLVTLLALVFDASAVTALNIMFGAFVIGGIIEGSISVYLYERGVRNG
jgi:hypothetical protein